ncbi:MAG: putative DNA binding domain-containing protein [Acidimicrobiaceae bacterium]|nr:putative DNA binding domain-containing protein [Acidimicrobiaceae bacterium]
MTFQFLEADPLEQQVRAALQRLTDGMSPSQIETTQIDFKEEPDRREGKTVNPGSRSNEVAGSYLAKEMACMANTPGGGALILGIANDGARIGTELDAEWLRHRIYELTERKLTVDIREAVLDGCRILVLTTHEAVEPIRHEGRIRWRVDANCVEVDASTWHTRKLYNTGFDWSEQPSGHTIDDLSPVATEIARRYLRQRGSSSDIELGDTSPADLLRRLNLVDSDGRLTNSGSLLFVATPYPGIDYILRDTHGGDSRNRIRGNGPLLEQIYEVEIACGAANRTSHVHHGFAHSQTHAIPPLALREAIVNGSVHRDWGSTLPTTVEHTGDTMTVTSPGGFVGGIDTKNIISHPAVPRYRSLAEAVAALGIAERQGIGIARMTRDMLAIGRPRPEIHEISGPFVRVTLLGGTPDTEMIQLVADVIPAELTAGVEAHLLIDQLCRRGWIDTETSAPLLQRTLAETAEAISRLRAARISDEQDLYCKRPEEFISGVITNVAGVPANQPDAYRLSDEARERLEHLCPYLNVPENQNDLIIDWANQRGRVSSTEVSDLTGLSVLTSGRRLSALAEEGLIRPARAVRAGRGFHYLPATHAQGAEETFDQMRLNLGPQSARTTSDSD